METSSISSTPCAPLPDLVRNLCPGALGCQSPHNLFLSIARRSRAVARASSMMRFCAGCGFGHLLPLHKLRDFGLP